MLQTPPLVGHAVCIGDRRKFISALLTLNGEKLPRWAEGTDLEGKTQEEIAQSDAMRGEIQKGVDAVNARLASVEQVKKFTILPVEFTPEGGELTPTMKVKRRIVNDRYGKEIEAMYA
ncbi:hypothetical protein ACFL59_09485 [Planctomycetota bacterium]